MLLCKRHCQENKKQATELEKICIKHISDKGLVFKICKEILKLNIRKESWRDTSSDIQIANKHRKNSLQHMSLGRCKLENRSGSVLTPVRIPKHCNHSRSLLVGMQNGTTPLEDRLVVSYKTKHSHIIQ